MWWKLYLSTQNNILRNRLARYSEASLIKTLEELGIGRPSTYAPILDTIVSRNYVETNNKQFIPTELGFVVVELFSGLF